MCAGLGGGGPGLRNQPEKLKNSTLMLRNFHLKFTFAVVVVGLEEDPDYSDSGSENKLLT